LALWNLPDVPNPAPGDLFMWIDPVTKGIGLHVQVRKTHHDDEIWFSRAVLPKWADLSAISGA